MRNSARREGGEITLVGGPRGISPCETRWFYRRPGQAGAKPAHEWRRHDMLAYSQVFSFPEASEDRKKKQNLMASSCAALFPHHHSSTLVLSSLACIFIYFFHTHPLPSPHATLSFKLYLSFGFSPHESFQAERGLSGAKSLS